MYAKYVCETGANIYNLFGRGAFEKSWLWINLNWITFAKTKKSRRFSQNWKCFHELSPIKRNSIVVSTISVTSRNSADYCRWCFDNRNFHVSREDILGFSTLSLLSHMSNWTNSLEHLHNSFQMEILNSKNRRSRIKKTKLLKIFYFQHVHTVVVVSTYIHSMIYKVLRRFHPSEKDNTRALS